MTILIKADTAVFVNGSQRMVKYNPSTLSATITRILSGERIVSHGFFDPKHQIFYFESLEDEVFYNGCEVDYDQLLEQRKRAGIASDVKKLRRRDPAKKRQYMSNYYDKLSSLDRENPLRVRCPDGEVRKAYHNNLTGTRGRVYMNGKNVYGAIQNGVFVPKSKTNS